MFHSPSAQAASVPHHICSVGDYHAGLGLAPRCSAQNGSKGITRPKPVISIKMVNAMRNNGEPRHFSHCMIRFLSRQNVRGWRRLSRRIFHEKPHRYSGRQIQCGKGLETAITKFVVYWVPVLIQGVIVQDKFACTPN